MDDFCPIKGFDHVEFYVGNAKQAAFFYDHCFGFDRVAYSGLETGQRDTASYYLQQGDIRLVLTTALSWDHPFSKHVLAHGDGVGVIALEVPDARRAFEETTARGARPRDRADRGQGRQRCSALLGHSRPTAIP